MKDELADAFIVSGVEVHTDGEGEYKGAVDGLSVTVTRKNGEPCQRCWKIHDTVGSDAKHPTLCARCAGVVELNLG